MRQHFIALDYGSIRKRSLVSSEAGPSGLATLAASHHSLLHLLGGLLSLGTPICALQPQVQCLRPAARDALWDLPGWSKPLLFPETPLKGVARLWEVGPFLLGCGHIWASWVGCEGTGAYFKLK